MKQKGWTLNMPTPRLGYKVNGKSVPSVTTVIGRFDDKENLMAWAWRCGKEGLDYRTDGKRAAIAGTAAHDIIEQHLLNKRIDYDKIYRDHMLDDEQQIWVKNCETAFVEWRTKRRPNVEEMEVHYISEAYGYGGTPDAVGRLGNDRLLLDWKTSSSINIGYVTQCAAYLKMWEENNGERLDGVAIVRFDKKSSKYEELIVKSDELVPYFDEFLVCLNLYNMKQLNGTLRYKKIGPGWRSGNAADC